MENVKRLQKASQLSNTTAFIILVNNALSNKRITATFKVATNMHPYDKVKTIKVRNSKRS